MSALNVLPERYAVCRLAPEAAPPAWAFTGAIGSVTRTIDELSIVCLEADVPNDVEREGDWRVIQVAGPLDFGLTGIIAGLTAPLADAHIPVFALSTFNTDYLLLKEEHLTQAIHILQRSGHQITTPPTSS